MKIPHLDQRALKAMLHYEPETGVFTWLERSDVRPQWNGRYAGKTAGYARVATGGGLYWSIRIFDWPFHAHRLAWLYMTGAWPVMQVDHKDMDGLNNRWDNLREANKCQNGGNTKAKKNNKCGFKGVSLCKSTGKYRATISREGKQVWLGYHDTPELAHAAYRRAALQVFGEFARTA
jgi:hypothetical protein